MISKNNIKFIQNRQYNFSNQLVIDNILPSNINFEDYNSDLFNIRKKIKLDLDKKVLTLIVDYYLTSLTCTSHNISYKWEKNLLNEFVKFKTFMYKQMKGSAKKSKINMDPITNFSGEFILHIQHNHNICNILFDILNTETDYKRDQMVNFNTELQKINQSELIDTNIYNIYKQFNDIRNMFIHEDYMSLILSLKVEELQKIIQLLKLVEMSNIYLMRMHKDKISLIIKEFIDENNDGILRKINTAEEFFLGQCLNMLEENRLEIIKKNKKELKC